MARCCVKIRVIGHVQGVGFRFHTAHQGLMLDLNGYARNLSDGSVEVVACGERENIDMLIHWLHQGPQLATVDQLDTEISVWRHMAGFKLY